MKKQAYTMIALMVLIVSMDVAAQAQSGGRIELIANIPFQFNVGNKTMPAGEYKVTRVNPASDQAVLNLRSKDGRASANVQMFHVVRKLRQESNLLFHRYENQYFLAEVWVDGNDSGLRAIRSRFEQKAERQLAGIEPTTKMVALTSR